MNLEDFQLLDNEPIDNSIIKRDYLKVYHQQGANLNDPHQNVEFIFGENNKCLQFGNAYLEFDITVRRADNTNFADNSVIRLVNNAFAFCFKEALLSTTSGGYLEHKNFVGQISSIMRTLTGKDGHLLSQFHKINEQNTEAQFDSTSLKKMLFNNHTEVANKIKIKGQLALEKTFGFR